jgi:hypothetical protein
VSSTDAEALPLNTVALGDALLLRVLVTDGMLLHLAPRGSALPGKRSRPAVDARQKVGEGHGVYDGGALVDRIWSKRTLCGLSWWQMASQAHEIELAARAASTRLRGYACPWCAREALHHP